MNALELAVKASKAAKAEYWACDIAIDENTDEPYILECATAFAAFPYIRDWIGQYVMWDLSDGKFRMPHIPMFSWEELGKMDPSILRTLRNIYFAAFAPSSDGAYWLKDKEDGLEGKFDMELTDESRWSDMPDSIAPVTSEDELPEEVKNVQDNVPSHSNETIPLNLQSVSLTELMTLYGMDDEMAVEIKSLVDDEKVASLEDLVTQEVITADHAKMWNVHFSK
jgi:hypothetical protein